MKMDTSQILIKDYDYPLPAERIAVYPLEKRDDSRLLIYKKGEIFDNHFYNLHEQLPACSLLVVNNTKVIEARIFFQKPTGGVIEIFCLEPYEQSMESSLSQTSGVKWLCLIGGASKWKPGQILEKKIVSNGNEIILQAKYISRQTENFIIEFTWVPSLLNFGEILHAAGAIPLPPYLKREANKEDEIRYQTIFGNKEGSVAAPTSALHFTEEVFKKLYEKDISIENITLHVGAGTFKPVKTETIAGHHMHHEPFTVNKNTLQKILATEKIVAVGTTVLRTLESLYWIGVRMMHQKIPNWHLSQWEAYELDEKFHGATVAESLGHLLQWMEENNEEEIHCSTCLMVIPGYKFRIPCGIITNFHQPQSTLLLLVSAFIGKDWKMVYDHALKNNYRFLSYGDSSLLWK